jgi:signal transduction histidine kinase
VMGLRMSAKGAATLAESLAEVGLALAESTPMHCSVTTSGEVPDLRGHVMEELFSIGREALTNAFRHSRGSRVDVALHYDAKKITITVQDDGIGLPAAMLEHGKRAGHWGLPGMRERADTVNGTLTTVNLPDGGTCVVLTVPGRTAYVSQKPAWPALARWWSTARQR